MTCSDCTFWVRNPPDPNWIQADRHGTCSHPRRQFEGANKSWFEDDGCPYGSYQKTEEQLVEVYEMTSKKHDPEEFDPPCMVQEGERQAAEEAAVKPPKKTRAPRSDRGVPRPKQRKKPQLFDAWDLLQQGLHRVEEEKKKHAASYTEYQRLDHEEQRIRAAMSGIEGMDDGELNGS